MPLAVCAPFVTQARIIRRVILRSENAQEVEASLAEKHMSFENLDCRWSLIPFCYTEQLGVMFCHHSGNHAIYWLNVVRHKKRDDHTLSLQLRCKKLSPPLNIC